MSLPPITLTDSVTQPASEEKTYPHGFITMLIVRPMPGIANAAVIVRPYNQTTGELYPSGDRDYHHCIADIYAEAERVPLFAQALSSIVACVDLLSREATLAAKLASLQAEAATQDTIDSVAAELAGVRQSLGVQG